MPDIGGAGFAEFVEAELPKLLGLSRVLTGDENEAWDLSQECLVRVGVRWKQVDRDGNPGAYARRCLVRLHINRFRRLRRELLTPTPPEHSAEETGLEQVELIGVVRQLLAELPPRQRAVVVLRCVEDLSHAEIASVLDCSVGTARSQLSRALQRLRETSDSDPRLDDAISTWER